MGVKKNSGRCRAGSSGAEGSPREAQAPRLLALNMAVDPFSFCLGLA